MVRARMAKQPREKGQRLAKATALKGNQLIALTNPLKRPHRLSKVPVILNPGYFDYDIFEDDDDWALTSNEVVAKPRRNHELTDNAKRRLLAARLMALAKHQEIWGYHGSNDE